MCQKTEITLLPPRVNNEYYSISIHLSLFPQFEFVSIQLRVPYILNPALWTSDQDRFEKKTPRLEFNSKWMHLPTIYRAYRRLEKGYLASRRERHL